MKALSTILLLFLSNIFMTYAWYGHLKKGNDGWLQNWGLFGIILMSWAIAFFEYCLMVPANRIGSREMGGPFSLTQLKIIQEAISLTVFMVFVVVFFKHETLKWNHFVGFGFILLAVYFIFKN
jgi:uncharacterized protein